MSARIRIRSLLAVLALLLTGSLVAAPAYAAAPPTVSSLTPDTGPYDGGTTVTVTGTGFTDANAVTFSGVAAPSFTVTADTTLTAVSPRRWSGAGGLVDVRVTTPSGTSAIVLADRFRYVRRPTVTGLLPATGPYDGGTLVTITGTSLAQVTAVTFGGVPATGVTVLSETTVQALAPKRWSGASAVVDVLVTSVGGTSTSTPAGFYTYTNDVGGTVLTGIVPDLVKASESAGEPVTLTGVNLDRYAAVYLGSQRAATTTPVSWNTLTFTCPALAVGAYQVRLQRADGSFVTPAGSGVLRSVTGYPAPVLTSLSPQSGTQAGGTVVTVEGRYFDGATTAVLVGADALDAAAVQRVDSTTLRVTMPARAPGEARLAVRTSAGTSNALVFTYGVADGPQVSGVSPATGPAAGGYPVSVFGTGFEAATSVTFGGSPASRIEVRSGTEILAYAPAYPSLRTVDVQVGTPTRISPVVPADRFTYTETLPGQPPKPQFYIGPSSPTAGTQVALTGENLAGATGVSVNGVGAAYQIITDLRVHVRIPDGLTAGAALVFVVTNRHGSTSYTSWAVAGMPPQLLGVRSELKNTAAGPVFVSGRYLEGATYWLGDTQLTATYESLYEDFWGNRPGNAYVYRVAVPVLPAGEHTLTIRAPNGTLTPTFWVTDSVWCRTIAGTVTVPAAETLRIGCPEFSMSIGSTLVIEPGATFDLPNSYRPYPGQGVPLGRVVARTNGAAAPTLRGDLLVKGGADLEGAELTGNVGFGQGTLGVTFATPAAGSYSVRNSTFHARVSLGGDDANPIEFTGNVLTGIQVGGPWYQGSVGAHPALVVDSNGTTAASAPTVADVTVTGCHTSNARRCASLLLSGRNIHPEKVTGFASSDVDLVQKRISGVVTGQWRVGTADSDVPWIVGNHWNDGGTVWVAGTLILEPMSRLGMTPPITVDAAGISAAYVTLVAEDRLVKPGPGQDPAQLGLSLFVRASGAAVTRIDCSGLSLATEPVALATAVCR